MTYSFCLADIPINVAYKNVKSLRMTVYPPDGRVCISAPPDASRETIRQFAASKMQWLRKHRGKFRHKAGEGELHPKQGRDRPRNSAVHLVWGDACTLELVEKPGRSKITLEEQNIRLQVPPNTGAGDTERILDRWYHRLMREASPALIRKWEPVIGVRVDKIYYRKMKSRWGTCNFRRRTIRLNTELAKKPPACLEYVIVHELLHIIEPAHNRRFYQLMGRLIPAWKTIRKKMNAGEL
jgi:predicted metal-dependent hydrolase